MPVDPYAEFQQPAAQPKQAAGIDPYAEFQQPQVDNTPKEQPSAASRFWDGLKSTLDPTPLVHAGLEAANGNFQPAGELAHNAYDASVDQLKQAGDGFKQFIAPGMSLGDRGAGLYSGVVHTAGALPMIGPPAIHAGERIRDGDVAGGLGESAGIVAPMALGLEGKFNPMEATGEGLRYTAGQVAESSQGIRGQSHLHGANPGAGILQKTTGIRPKTILKSARDVSAKTNAALEADAAAAPGPTHVSKPLGVIQDAKAHAGAYNSTLTPAALQPMEDYFTKPTPTFVGATEYPQGSATPISYQQSPTGLVGPNSQPLMGPPKVTPGITPDPVVADEQTPRDMLGLRRRFSTDYIRNWDKQADPGPQKVAQQAYGAATGEVHRTVPGSLEKDQTLASLAPVIRRAEATDLNHGPVPRFLNRFGVHTGALAATATGAALGHANGGGGLGALAGGLAFGAIPEMIADPTVKMAEARIMDATGKVLQHPLVQKAAALGPTLVRKQKSNSSKQNE